MVDRPANKRKFLVFKRADGTEQRVELMSTDTKLTLNKETKQSVLAALASPLDLLTTLVAKVETALETDELLALPESLVTDALGIGQAVVATVAPSLQHEVEAAQQAIELAKSAGTGATIMKNVIEAANAAAAKLEEPTGKLNAETLAVVKRIHAGLSVLKARFPVSLTKSEDDLPAPALALPSDLGKASGVAARVLREVADTGAAVLKAMEALESGTLLKAGPVRAIVRMSDSAQALEEKFPAEAAADVAVSVSKARLVELAKGMASPADVAMALAGVIKELPGTPQDIMDAVGALCEMIAPYCNGGAAAGGSADQVAMSEKADVAKAEWDTAYINDLPDSAFLYIEAGGSKDADGKTEPRSLRHFPVRDASGAVDEAHARDAIGRIPQSDAPGLDDAKKASLQDEARKLMESVKKTEVVETTKTEPAPAASETATPPAAVSTEITVTPTPNPELEKAIAELNKATEIIKKLEGEQKTVITKHEGEVATLKADIAKLQKSTEAPASRPTEGSPARVNKTGNGVPIYPNDYNDPEYKAAVAKAGGLVY